MSRKNRTAKTSRRVELGSKGAYEPFSSGDESTYYKKPAPKARPLEAQTETQGYYISSILHNDITLGTGPAGTGKTYVATSLACEELDSGRISKIIITRPAVEVDEDFGFLPGSLEEKYSPYLQPFMDCFIEKFGKSKTEYLIKSKIIEARPLAFMRGSTISNAWALLDEAQNCTVNQMKMFLTRIGHNAKFIINGDIRQSDIKGCISGLEDAVSRFDGMNRVGVVEFTRKDCVRHGLTGEIISRYED